MSHREQAEVMATIREAYGIARDDKIKLRDFPTLAHVIRFVYEEARTWYGASRTNRPGNRSPAGSQQDREVKRSGRCRQSRPVTAIP